MFSVFLSYIVKVVIYPHVSSLLILLFLLKMNNLMKQRFP